MNALQARNNPAAVQPYIDFKRSQAVLEANIDLEQLRRPAGPAANNDAVDLSRPIRDPEQTRIQEMKHANQIAREASDLMRTADEGLGRIEGILTQMREVSQQALNEELGPVELAELDQQFDTMRTEIRQVANQTVQRGQPLINGMFGQQTLPIGAEEDLSLTLMNADIVGLGLTQTEGLTFKGEAVDLDGGVGEGGAPAAFPDEANLQTPESSRQTINRLDIAVGLVNRERSYLGSMQSRIQFTVTDLSTPSQSAERSRVTIENIEFATEAIEVTREQIVTQTSSSVMAQAGGVSQNILQLIQ
jgi:flagellin